LKKSEGKSETVIEEEQRIQWTTEKVNDLQNTAQEIKD
jgi:hypothetical protein